MALTFAAQCPPPILSSVPRLSQTAKDYPRQATKPPPAGDKRTPYTRQADPRATHVPRSFVKAVPSLPPPGIYTTEPKDEQMFPRAACKHPTVDHPTARLCYIQIHKMGERYLVSQVTARNPKHQPPTKTFASSGAAIVVAMRCVRAETTRSTFVVRYRCRRSRCRCHCGVAVVVIVVVVIVAADSPGCLFASEL